MLDPKQFLLEECENVSRLLGNTLRYAYSSESSEDVYTECLVRLRLIRSRVVATPAANSARLNELSVHLSNLSQLIGRVERSHIEEFSWPFAHALQDLARNVCEPTADDTLPPLFFISADDELFSYQIRTEENDPGLIERPLFNIIFPRSLKHFALLHPILGHEVGHAAYAVPELGAELEASVISRLVSRSSLTDLTKFEQWVRRSRSELDMDELTQAAMSWPEELYCDLFGLLFMGPSYLAANNTLLLGTQEPSDSHPGSLTRCWMMNEAIKHLGWNEVSRKADPTIRRAVVTYFDRIGSVAQSVPKRRRLLNPVSIAEALTELIGVLSKKGNALFKMPSLDQLNLMTHRLLKARPPVETTVSQKLVVANENVDFRAILYAGWLAWYSDRRNQPGLTFFILNLLCDRGLLQQSAVDHLEDYERRRRTA